ncbi:MAG: ATP-binding protein [Deltaproteobacteria bacterium]|jgi:hypothetical protein|nr:ATP-binding protein [Deltaproteobacteria bacterium]
MKLLPISLQTFQDIIEGGYLYVDKTKFVYEAVSQGKAYFLSRPRRFGKTLLLSTFEALFNGPTNPNGPPQGLFAGLWISQTDYDFTKRYPVVNLDMSGKSDSPETLEQRLKDRLLTYASLENLDISAYSLDMMLYNLIEGLNYKYGTRVVVLIDEYDAPVSDNLANIKVAKANHDILRYFYSVLKSCDRYLHFVFVTGVTSYAFMGISSGLNHLNDLTLNNKFAGVCGFTIDECDDCFKEWLSYCLKTLTIEGRIAPNSTLADLRSRMFNWYGGYSWDGKTRVLNPIDILNFFNKLRFSNYWADSYPSVAFLSNMVGDDPFVLVDVEYKRVSHTSLAMAEVGALETVPALFYTGYLTVDKIFHDLYYGTTLSLKVPNLEIQRLSDKVFSDSIFKILAYNPQSESQALERAFVARDGPKITEIFTSLFTSLFASLAAIHYQDENESFYHRLIFAYLFKLGRLVFSEQPVAIGMSDIVFNWPKKALYAIIEVKYESTVDDTNIEEKLTQLAQKALKTIDTKDYWHPYKAQAKTLIKIGIGVVSRGRCLALTD